MQAPELPEAEVHATFERLLEEALRCRQVTDALHRPGGRLDRAQLRTRALQARDDIAAAAAVEYRQLVEARAGGHRGLLDAGTSAGAEPGEPGTGGGLLPALAVLVPSLAAVAAALFLAIGFSFSALGGRPYVSDGLITSGLIAAAVAVGGGIGDLGYLIVTAARNRSTDQADRVEQADQHGQSGRSGLPDDTVPDVPRAREEWELALLERGVLPFLLGRLEESSRGDAPPRATGG
ncbi:hypothetical protein A6P39_019445 [Streptomyces sp. FXJ1.172]|uniref:hypothetical protein n=1 Tax=Streptomyces sp. FXJ1.172 TaxID=710705 RepID=UPI0007CF95E6|nr:hypothetical protein [Streptomyces sp. FXJ1.172]WEO96035.1 hypothetical protein A6P39_019445 [Streptomyces sp. FXJ1.172]